jgi:hypothetical protein
LEPNDSEGLNQLFWDTASTEYIPFGAERIGRQSRTGIRTAHGWKIVAAHVSFLA